MSFCSNATLPKVVIDIGTFCSLSERFCAVTVISSSCAAGAGAGAVSASAHQGPRMAAIPVQTGYPFVIPIFFSRADSFILPDAAQEYPVALHTPRVWLI